MVSAKKKIPPIYELKHRITGAIILISLAVIIIPEILSEPTIRAHSQSGGNGDVQSFRSVIEPVDKNSSSINQAGLPLIPGNTYVSKKLPSIDNQDGSQIDKSSYTPTITAIEPRPALIKAPDTAALGVRKESADKKNEKKSNVKVEKDVDVKSVSALDPQKKTKKSKVVVKPSYKSLGWSVRIGTFVKAGNVTNMVELLEKNGFQPRKTKVQTKLGKAVRVWLGPYGKRTTADRINKRLHDLLGETGYISRESS